jgi:hypothetical protein
MMRSLQQGAIGIGGYAAIVLVARLVTTSLNTDPIVLVAITFVVGVASGTVALWRRR